MPARIMAGCPVRNRAWVLPTYLTALTQMDYPPEAIEFCFVINNCQDETPAILRDFARSCPSPVRLVEEDYSRPGGFKRGYYSLARLADLRNRLLREFLDSACTHLFSVDSDIILPASALRQLLADNCPVVSALVCNGHELEDSALFNVLNRDDQGSYRHIRDIPAGVLFPVDCTGAACLIAREVIEEYGVRYAADKGAEDIGFCEEVSRNGLGIYCDSRVEGLHLMNEGMLADYRLQNCFP
ncbi:MAG: glycosyltransferase family 2 protein [Syntrophomonas sp.]